MTDDADAKLYRDAALALWGDPGMIEIEEDAKVTPNIGGAYVCAWVWVSEEDAADHERSETPAEGQVIDLHRKKGGPRLIV
jgi:hypothetical protein